MRVLTINSGSSSIKFSLYRMDLQEELLARGSADGIGLGAGSFRAAGGSGTTVDKDLVLPDHAAALEEIMAWMDSASDGPAPVDAVGHRIVHGGRAYSEPQVIGPELISALREIVPFAPDHLPHEIDSIRICERVYPGVPQVACFDTAFHRTMPIVAQRYALPDEVQRHGVVRYGFHGLSYEYILSELRRSGGPSAADGRVIIAHLGNGASMGAFRNGKSKDTTMGFTPAGGLVMSTRSGDLDPGVIVYLVRNKGMDAVSINRMVNKDAGLLAVSGTSADMKELLARSAQDHRAAEAVELFCYQAKKHLAALSAVLGGLDTLVFTGGIGEHAPSVREGICSGMEFIGIRLDGRRNGENEAVISADSGPVSVRVMRTNEEVMIARHTHALVKDRRGS